MNEVHFIARQLQLERAHLREAATAMLALPAGVRPGTELLDYLRYALERFEQRAAAEAAVLHERLERAAPLARATLRAALAALAQAQHAARTLHDEATSIDVKSYPYQFFLETDQHLETLAAGLRAAYVLGEWRRLGLLDADAVLEERRRYGALPREATGES